MRNAVITLGLVVLTIAGCAPREPNLVNLPPKEGPDEFAILPTKPLQAPPDFAALPAPTPGGTNLVDPTPRADAVAALGGGREARSTGDAALVAHATRFGVAPDIRPALAAEDLEFRRANDGRVLERVFNVNVYFDAYEPLELDQHQELERFRAAGVPTPAAPPEIRE